MISCCYVPKTYLSYLLSFQLSSQFVFLFLFQFYLFSKFNFFTKNLPPERANINSVISILYIKHLRSGLAQRQYGCPLATFALAPRTRVFISRGYSLIQLSSSQAKQTRPSIAFQSPVYSSNLSQLPFSIVSPRGFSQKMSVRHIKG